MSLADVTSVFPELASQIQSSLDDSPEKGTVQTPKEVVKRAVEQENLKNMLLMNKIHSIMHEIEVLEQQTIDEEEAKHQVVYDAPEQTYQFVFKPKVLGEEDLAIMEEAQQAELQELTVEEEPEQPEPEEEAEIDKDREAEAPDGSNAGGDLKQGETEGEEVINIDPEEAARITINQGTEVTKKEDEFVKERTEENPQ
mmetsp:Transcript_15735/g.24187  ORF Transcript_15735/g.24187 Transcript_15735/m.24187 type:complete len:198 (+) Transcript_15735:1235-1828(+)